ncbi:hypothetical protein ABZ511_21465 [Nocardia gamkensis]|uniref:hypothetical protein n=1 Tax=Nocardia gamkensis TaxID=352869 RepID=UPI0033CA9358
MFFWAISIPKRIPSSSHTIHARRQARASYSTANINHSMPITASHITIPLVVGGESHSDASAGADEMRISRDAFGNAGTLPIHLAEENH